jgi:hypothetical protein
LLSYCFFPFFNSPVIKKERLIRPAPPPERAVRLPGLPLLEITCTWLDYNTIEVIDISDPSAAEIKGNVNVGFGVETIFPYKDKLFIGSVDGMYIYDLANPQVPKKLGEARHVRSCDPVVANDSVAYVTLRGSGNCGAATDGLYTYTTSPILLPRFKKACYHFPIRMVLG